MKFESIEFLWFVVCIPLYWLSLLRLRWIRQERLKKFLSFPMQEILVQPASSTRVFWKSAMLSFALVCVVFALLRPQAGVHIEKIEQQSLDICLAIDTSKSMLATDIAPTRLQMAKKEMRQFFESLQGDRVALIAFAGGAVLQCPLTHDYGAAALFLDVVDETLVPIPGTAVGAAITLAIDKVFSSGGGGKVMLLLTDGEDHGSDVLQAARRAALEGIRIYTIGIGSSKGAPIPMGAEQRGEYRKNQQGEIVLSKLDSESLSQIAEITGGRYFHVEGEKNTLTAVLEEIERLEGRKFSELTRTVYSEQFQYFLLLAVLFLAVEAVLSNRGTAHEK